MRPLLLQLLRTTAACSSATAACGRTPHFLLLPPLLQHSVPRQAACLAGGGAWGHPRMQQGLSSSSGEGEGAPPEAVSGGSPSTSDSAPHEQQQQPVDGQEGGQPLHPSSTISSASSSSSSSSSASRISSGSSSSDSSGSISSTPDVAVARASTPLRSADDVFGAPGEQQGQQPPLPTAADVDLEEAMSSRAPARVRVEQHEPTPGELLVSKEYGYAALGGVLPAQGAGAFAGSAHPRINPYKTFLPGQTYEAGELNAYAPPSAVAAKQRKGQRNRRPMPSAKDVLVSADFKNVAFLERFLSPAGKILHSKATRLPPPLQAKVSRQIKLARNMALIAGESLYEKRHLRFLREAEERQRSSHRQ